LVTFFSAHAQKMAASPPLKLRKRKAEDAELLLPSSPSLNYDGLPECMICLRAVGWPVVTTPCDHHFCHTCLEDWFLSQRNASIPATCPVCRHNCEEQGFRENKEFSLVAGRQTVFCSAPGCSHQARADSIPAHLAHECSVNRVDCRYAEQFFCRWRGPAALRAQHERECQLVDVARLCKALRRREAEYAEKLAGLELRASIAQSKLEALEQQQKQTVERASAVISLINGAAIPLRTFRFRCTEPCEFELELNSVRGPLEAQSGFQIQLSAERQLRICAVEESLRYPLALLVCFAAVNCGPDTIHCFTHRFQAVDDCVVLLPQVPAELSELRFLLHARKLLLLSA
jgi:hypothetical protein